MVDVAETERTCVVVIRAWIDGDGVRARIITDESPQGDARETVVASADAVCDTVRTYLEDRLG